MTSAVTTSEGEDFITQIADSVESFLIAVRAIAAEGERFDPHPHQAVFEVPDASVPAGTVVQVMQGGYTIGDRVLRAAMVGVSKGGAASAQQPQAETAGS